MVLGELHRQIAVIDTGKISNDLHTVVFLPAVNEIAVYLFGCQAVFSWRSDRVQSPVNGKLVLRAKRTIEISAPAVNG
ncbi:hypothetical protein [Halalkalicoccus salilacus]|uniref:hypothetical protein n=1 Tax=Halalkalicoccus sp. GCM10025704 TaxID=3252662 RepID=UPI0036F2897D